ncbi:MAG: hypothetical protein ACYC0B_04800 [Gemmatimonadaceae bacterium]
MRKFATSRVRQLCVSAFAIVGLAAACSGSATAVPEEPVVPFDSTGTIVTFIFRDYPEDTMRVLMRWPAYIDAARARMQQADPPNWGNLGQNFLKGPGIDSNYAFHWNPDLVGIGDGRVGCHLGPLMRTEAEVGWWIENGHPFNFCAIAFPIAIDEPSE